MKKIIAISFLILIACQNRQKESSTGSKDQDGIPEFEFREEFHNFGSLQAGEVVAYSFQFTNSGTGSLEIEEIEKDCGCLEVNYPLQPIAVGETDFIEVVFNSDGETGRVYKELLIHSNAKSSPAKLAIAATVENEIINLYSKN